MIRPTGFAHPLIPAVNDAFVFMFAGWTSKASPVVPLHFSEHEPDHGQELATTACKRCPWTVEIGPHSRS